MAGNSRMAPQRPTQQLILTQKASLPKLTSKTTRLSNTGITTMFLCITNH